LNSPDVYSPVGNGQVSPPATAGSQAAAQQKVSQELAKYQATPKDKQRCDGCASFQAPNACKVVEGDISPSGWCQLFVPKA
jgi:hypothetical protein